MQNGTPYAVLALVVGIVFVGVLRPAGLMSSCLIVLVLIATFVCVVGKYVTDLWRGLLIDQRQKLGGELRSRAPARRSTTSERPQRPPRHWQCPSVKGKAVMTFLIATLMCSREERRARGIPRGQLTIAGLILSMCACLTGCNFSGRIGSDAVSYNQAVERVGNELLLLNIVRAMHRRPMYFTGLSQIRGSFSHSTNGSIGLTRQSEMRDRWTYGGGTDVTSKPSFDVAVLDSERFMRGITKPVTPRLFEYYWSQGWPKAMLLHLFVRTIESNGRVLVNRPGDPTFADFQREVHGWLEDDVHLVATLDWEAIGPPFLEDALPAGVLLKGVEKGFDVAPMESGVADEGLASKEKPLKEAYYLWKSTHRVTLRTNTLFCGVCSEPATENRNNNRRAAPLPESGKEAERGAVDKLFLRSPEAMLYYLGETMRSSQAGTDTIIQWGATPVPLFVGVANYPGDAVVTVEYDGVRYSIPRDEERAGRSMHCLSLVSQILALHKSSTELPTTSAVTLVGN